MIRKINHVGIVVRDIDEALKVFSNIFGFEVVESITSPQSEFRLVLISKGNVSLELIEPINPEGSIANFLKQRGEGLHHIALDVDDIEQELESLRAMSVSLVNKEPESMLSTRVAFVHPRSTAEGMRQAMVKIDDFAFEVIEPTDPQSGLSQFLGQHGEGIHHISFEVEDLPYLIKSLKTEGVTVIERGDKAAFMHPKSFKGVLVQLYETGSQS